MSTQTDPLCIYCVEFDACAKTYPACGATSPCSNAFDLPGTWNTCTKKCLYECGIDRRYYSNCRIPSHIQTELGITKFSVSVVGAQSHVPVKISFGDTFSRPASYKFCLSGTKSCNDPFESTPLARLIDAHKYWEGRRVIAYFGDSSMALCEFERHVFYIKSVEGPTGSDCQYCFDVRSPLSSLDGVKCPDGLPKKSVTGEQAQLVTGLPLPGVATDSDPDSDPTSVYGSFILSNNLLDDGGKQAACISQAKMLCIDGELVGVNPCINDTVQPGFNWIIKERGLCGSTIKAHDAGAKITVPLVFQPHEHIVDVVERILTECADMPSVFLLCCTDTNEPTLDYDSLEQYRCKFPLQTLNDYVVICQPTEAKVLLKSLAQSFLFSLYDERGVIKMAGLCPTDDDPEILNQWQVLEASEITRNTGDRATAVIYRTQVSDWTKKGSGDNLINETGIIREDFLREPCDRREYPQPSVKIVESIWLSGANDYLAYTSAMRWRKILACPPDELCVTLTLRESKRFPVTQKARLEISKNRDYTGEYKQQDWIVTSRQIVKKGEQVKVCFRESPFADENPALSCEFQFPAESDDCGDTCVSVW